VVARPTRKFVDLVQTSPSVLDPRSMCGISGIISKVDRPVAREQIEKINRLVAHRGPDGEGYFFGPNFAFGHRRLSILDLSNHGHQPMVYQDRYRITYNGEIYNYLELRRELEGFGFTFVSGSDTEVILAAYAKWGNKCCERFNGMWAFAIHDAVAQKIFLARDRFGVKPLYYCESDEQLVFGSEIKQLLAGRVIRANRSVVIGLLLTAIDGYGADTYFEGIQSFPRSHFAVYDLRTHSFTMHRYYRLCVDGALQSLTMDEAVAKLGELFESSVHLRLRSDVRVGTCLSGGLDSSATSAVASKFYRAATTQRFLGIHAKSIDAETDESRFARAAAAHSNIELHTVEPQSSDFLANIDELIDTQEEPFGSPSMFMGWHVFKRARELGCKVMLNGQGGDEVLLGYERYFSTFLRSVPPQQFLREAMAQARHSRLSLKDVLLYSVYFTSPAIRKFGLKRRSLLRPEIKNSYDFSIIDQSVRSFRRVEDLQLFEIMTVQLPHLLRYEDRNSMRHSIETRLPFLDYRLVEFCVSIAPQFKIREGWTKYVLRRAMEQVLPSEVTWRKDKMGFAAPERTWIGSATKMMKDEIAGSKILAEITQRDRLLQEFADLPLRRKWSYFMIAAWERRLGVAW
jgi:asparagine synthase (glutamine-hydrolysing)